MCIVVSNSSPVTGRPTIAFGNRLQSSRATVVLLLYVLALRDKA